MLGQQTTKLAGMGPLAINPGKELRPAVLAASSTPSAGDVLSRPPTSAYQGGRCWVRGLRVSLSGCAKLFSDGAVSGGGGGASLPHNHRRLERRP